MEKLYVNNRKMVESIDLYDKVENLQANSDSRYYKPDSKNGHKRSHEEYFDNLLMIIEKAAQGLSI